MYRSLDYFLAAKGADGFCSLFSGLMEEPTLRLYILKGTAGCGKSTLMKRAAKRASSSGAAVELVRCASDPSSLDAVVCRELGFAIADGTPPHVIEPKLPCLSHRVLSLYDCVDPGALAPFAKKVDTLIRNCDEFQSKSSHFVEAAARLYRDELAEAEGGFRREDALPFTDELAGRLLPTKAQKGFLRFRIGGAVTPDGLVDFIPEIAGQYEHRIAIRDRGGVLSDLLLRRFSLLAKKAGYPCSVYLLPFVRQDYIEAVTIDELSLCLFSDGFPGRREVPGSRGIRATRFACRPTEAERRVRSRFRRRAAYELLSEASVLLREAKVAHDRLEEIYAFAANFTAVDQISADLFRTLGI